MAARYTMSLDESGQGNITVAQNGEYETIDSDHPNFKAVFLAVYEEADLEAVRDIIVNGDGWSPNHEDIVELTDRVTIEGGNILLDGKPAPATLSATITRYRSEGRPFMGLVKFLERLDNNPSFRSREQLFNWTSRNDLEIDEDGYLIGYRGVGMDMLSSHSGSAYVDDVLVEGRIPNMLGTVISMDREDVQDDPNITCSHGLHVGNLSYAKGFNRVLLHVKVDPADVVSVPSDYSGQKMRVCRFEVIEVIEPEVEPDFEPTAATDNPEVIERLAQVIPEKFLAKLLRKTRAARAENN